jgi:DNA topoisomerase-1
MPHQLIICEKPSAAWKIAYALGGGRTKRRTVKGVPVYRFERDGREVTVVPALGHLYAVSQQSVGWSFPVFNLGWVPIYEVNRKRGGKMRTWIEVISRLAKDADSFVSACDFDTEGSLIAYMILKHACGGADAKAGRMKFSTLTRTDLMAAYDNMMGRLDLERIGAGKTRHELDWIFGVNVSRALMDSLSRSSGKFEVLSAGRVQSPTLYILYRREVAVNLHVPDPFWTIGAEVGIKGKIFPAAYELKAIFSRGDAEDVAGRCNGSKGTVKDIKAGEAMIPPPPPFDLGGLQSEAYRLFGYTPSKTQRVAERLYLNALISYPRTSSQKLPRSLNFEGLIRSLGRNPNYRELADELLSSGRPLRPREGSKTDPAHPAIHPTGNVFGGGHDRDEFRVYDLIVKRFLATFGEWASKKITEMTIVCGEGDLFKVRGEKVEEAGWMRYYHPYASLRDFSIPEVAVGEEVDMKRVWVEDRFTSPPPRFNPNSVLKYMERNGLGTKATRAEILDTMYRRGYIQGLKIGVTDLGFAVISILRKFFPELISVELTRKMEKDMEGLETGTKRTDEVVTEAIDEIKPVFDKIISEYDRVGEELVKVMDFLREGRRTLGKCPGCREGNLVVIYSRKTGKRFVGCTNYSNGCRFSLPLPQRGRITPAGRVCRTCGYPIVEVRGLSARVWRLCINDKCPSKEKREQV